MAQKVVLFQGLKFTFDLGTPDSEIEAFLLAEAKVQEEWVYNDKTGRCEKKGQP